MLFVRLLCEAARVFPWAGCPAPDTNASGLLSQLRSRSSRVLTPSLDSRAGTSPMTLSCARLVVVRGLAPGPGCGLGRLAGCLSLQRTVPVLRLVGVHARWRAAAGHRALLEVESDIDTMGTRVTDVTRTEELFALREDISESRGHALWWKVENVEHGLLERVPAF